jgi:FMN-dependent NADH-azoreductase
MNHAQPYLETILGFMGITDVETIYVEGVGMGADAVMKAVEAARGRIHQLAIAA